MTDLRFIGDWRLWGGVVVGLGLAVAAWLLYWRETRTRAGAVRWVLPTLRALAVLLLVLMLTGPVLRHRNTIGEVARILKDMEVQKQKVVFKGTLPEFFTFLRTDKRFQPTSAEQLRKGYEAIGKRIDARVGEQFGAPE